MSPKPQPTFKESIDRLDGMDLIEQLQLLSRGEIHFTPQEIDSMVAQYRRFNQWVAGYILLCALIFITLLTIFFDGDREESGWVIGFLFVAIVPLKVFFLKLDHLQTTCAAVCLHWKVVKHWMLFLGFFERRYRRVWEVWRSRGTLEKTKDEEVGVYALADYVEAMAEAGVQGKGLLRGISHSRFLSLTKNYLLPIKHPGAERLHSALMLWKQGLQ